MVSFTFKQNKNFLQEWKQTFEISVQNGFWGKLETSDNAGFKSMHPLKANSKIITGLCLEI